MKLGNLVIEELREKGVGACSKDCPMLPTCETNDLFCAQVIEATIEETWFIPGWAKVIPTSMRMAKEAAHE